MENLNNEINKRMETLKAIIKEKESALAKKPPGFLHISEAKGKSARYYWNKRGSTEKYLSIRRPADNALIHELAQKQYDMAVLRAGKKELHCLEQYSKSKQTISAEEIYMTYGKTRQELITPIKESDEEFKNRWEETPYEPKAFGENSTEYYTNREERVRSKSEILIANMLNQLQIPYRYECPLVIGNVKIYPDFTVLNVRKRETMYLEHLGMMDDPQYYDKAIKRIQLYESNGIYVGDKLILSYETENTPLNLRVLKGKLEYYFI